MKGYIFDFGGTLDTNGSHWGRFIWHAYRRHHVPVNFEEFAEAYVYAEQQLGRQSIIQPTYSFRKTLITKLRMEIEHLVTVGYLYGSPLEQERCVAALTDDLYRRVERQTAKSREVLLQLKEQYPLVMCSNFYGNLQEVLCEFHLDDLFQDVVESTAVGVRKPDEAIYRLAMRSFGDNVQPQDITVVGDSLKNDIQPAKVLGMQAIHLKGEAWKKDDGENPANRIIKDIKELLDE